MERIKYVNEVTHRVKEWRNEGLTVGFVPTMGSLHEGHASLIRAAAGGNDRVIVSVFINPMQFGPTEDLACYPRDIARDTEISRENGAHLMFHPEPEEMYPEGFCSYIEMKGGPTENLCGARRPGHFRGVCTVVAKLFHIVQPDRAYFGQKDAQQLAVIRRMVHDFNMPVEIVGCPIVRESDGLAMSSRNQYLNADERKAALCLFEGLNRGMALIEAGETNPDNVAAAVTKRIEAESLARLDYVALVHPDTIRPIGKIDGPVLCAVAAYIGNTRLIDNFVLRGKEVRKWN